VERRTEKWCLYLGHVRDNGNGKTVNGKQSPRIRRIEIAKRKVERLTGNISGSST
jgi:hypothetical protein